MIDFAKQLIQQHFVLLFATGLVLLALFLAVLVFLFRKFSGTPAEQERTRQAVELELSLLEKLGRLVRFGRRKTDTVAAVVDQNELTISRPIPAVPPLERKP